MGSLGTAWTSPREPRANGAAYGQLREAKHPFDPGDVLTPGYEVSEETIALPGMQPVRTCSYPDSAVVLALGADQPFA